MTLASGGSPMFPLVVHHQLIRHSGGVYLQIQVLQRGEYVDAVEEMMCVYVLQRGNSGDGCDLAVTVCRYDLINGDLFVELGMGATSETGKYLFRADNM